MPRKLGVLHVFFDENNASDKGVYTLYEGDNYIGSSEDAGVVLSLPEIDATHCRITLSENEYSIEDCGSREGVFRGTDGTRQRLKPHKEYELPSGKPFYISNKYKFVFVEVPTQNQANHSEMARLDFERPTSKLLSVKESPLDRVQPPMATLPVGTLQAEPEMDDFEKDLLQDDDKSTDKAYSPVLPSFVNPSDFKNSLYDDDFDEGKLNRESPPTKRGGSQVENEGNTISRGLTTKSFKPKQSQPKLVFEESSPDRSKFLPEPKNENIELKEEQTTQQEEKTKKKTNVKAKGGKKGGESLLALLGKNRLEDAMSDEEAGPTLDKGTLDKEEFLKTPGLSSPQDSTRNTITFERSNLSKEESGPAIKNFQKKGKTPHEIIKSFVSDDELKLREKEEKEREEKSGRESKDFDAYISQELGGKTISQRMNEKKLKGKTKEEKEYDIAENVDPATLMRHLLEGKREKGGKVSGDEIRKSEDEFLETPFRRRGHLRNLKEDNDQDDEEEDRDKEEKERRTSKRTENKKKGKEKVKRRVENSDEEEEEEEKVEVEKSTRAKRKTKAEQEKEKREKEKFEKEKEKERLKRDKEAEREKERERRESEKEKQRMEAERKEKEKREQERIAREKEKQEIEKKAREKKEKERLQKERQEKEILEKQEREKKEKERIEREREAKEKEVKEKEKEERSTRTLRSRKGKDAKSKDKEEEMEIEYSKEPEKKDSGKLRSRKGKEKQEDKKEETLMQKLMKKYEEPFQWMLESQFDSDDEKAKSKKKGKRNESGTQAKENGKTRGKRRASIAEEEEVEDEDEDEDEDEATPKKAGKKKRQGKEEKNEEPKAKAKSKITQKLEKKSEEKKKMKNQVTSDEEKNTESENEESRMEIEEKPKRGVKGKQVIEEKKKPEKTEGRRTRSRSKAESSDEEEGIHKKVKLESGKSSKVKQSPVKTSVKSPVKSPSKSKSKSSAKGKGKTQSQEEPILSEYGRSKRVSYKVLFTGFQPKDKEVEAAKRRLKLVGLNVTEDRGNFNVLVMQEFKRTIKFLLAVSKGISIVTFDWVQDCLKEGKILPMEEYAYRNKQAENEFNFKLSTALEKARSNEKGLMEGYKVWIPNDLKPSREEMKELIESMNGTVLKTKPTKNQNDLLIILNENDEKQRDHFINLKMKIYSTEFIYSGILQQKMNFGQNQMK